MSVIDDILERKRPELAERERRVPLERLVEEAEAMPPVRDFAAALRRPAGAPVRLLAEIKAASPSEGQIRGDFDPKEIAGMFERAGCAAISVLTETNYFGGSDDHLRDARASVSLPTLRKDFTITEYQIWESRVLGADAILLMTQVLDSETLSAFLKRTHALGMTALVEAHSEAELERALATGARVIGINNRDFNTLTTDIATTERLRDRVPRDRILISQSGLNGPDDVERLARIGVDAVQVGTSIMRQDDIAGFLRRLMGGE